MVRVGQRVLEDSGKGEVRSMDTGRWTGMEATRTAGKPEPIRPRGVSSRLPLLLFVAIAAALYMGYQYLTESELVRTAEAFVRQDPEIRGAVGEVRSCRLWFPFKIDFPEEAPQLDITLLVEGAKADTKARVTLKLEGTRWRIVAASYEDGKGMVRPLLKKAKPATPKAEAVLPSVPPPAVKPQEKDKADSKISEAAEELEKGYRFLRGHDYDQAIVSYERVIRLAPDIPDGYAGRGRAYTAKGFDKQAMADLLKAVKLRPDDVGAWRILGFLQGKNNRFDECIVSLSRAIELGPDHGWTFYNRSRCYFKKGDRIRAAGDAQKSCRLGIGESCKLYDQLKSDT